MERIAPILKSAVAAFLVAAASASAQTQSLDDLYAELASPDTTNWQSVESRIWTEWSRSGSASMDLLLQRGRKAMEDGDFATAIDHFTALIDHAPDFAEGWNGRATAFYNLGRFGESISDIQHVLALNPRHFGAISGLAMMLEEIGDEEGALDMYRRAHALNPHRPDLDEAIERLEKKGGGVDL